MILTILSYSLSPSASSMWRPSSPASLMTSTSQYHLEDPCTPSFLPADNCENRINVLREKAIASRFVTIDSQLESAQKPPRRNKTRANYRGLTSSPLTASRPSITRSFATEDTASHLSPASIYSTASSGSEGEIKKSV